MVAPSRTPEARRRRAKKREALASVTKEEATAIAATPLVLDFTDIPVSELPYVKGGVKDPEKRKLLDRKKKQVRARVRRRGKITKEEFAILYKPVEEWDEEELARGRPRDSKGGFRGPKPKWITREMHEAALERFKYIIKSDVQAAGPEALKVIQQLMGDTEVDNKGRYRTPPSVKLSAATLLLEHSIGKPKVMVETDISVKLQGLMANVMVGPGTTGEDQLAQIAASEYAKLMSSEAAPKRLGPGGSSAGDFEDDPIDAEVIEDDD